MNFNEFSYRVGPPYCEEFGSTVKVHEGKFTNDKATFEISQVFYGKFTDSSQEQAVVVASCTPQVTAHPGFDYGLVYVYGFENGRPVLISAFAFGLPWQFKGPAIEPKRSDNLSLFDVIGVNVRNGSISFERMAGEARCCPKFRITQAYRWKNGEFVLVDEERKPWNEKTSNAPANSEGQNDFVGHYAWYVASIRRRIHQNWLRATIDPAARSSHGKVAFTVHTDGTVKEVRVIESSQNASFDNSMVRAVLASNPLPALPSDYKGPSVPLTIDFPSAN